MIVLILLVFVFVLLLVLVLARTRKKPEYKCFLLTLETSADRREKFLDHYDGSVPLEIIYGTDTRKLENAKKYQKIIEPNYYREALKLHYNANKTRPDITYFNLGAIGCYMGHMEFYRRCFEQNLKYAVIFEDNVIIKDKRVYREIQDVINTLGNDFEMCFFHCLSRLPDKRDGKLEKVKWISSTKCYLINVENMKKYT